MLMSGPTRSLRQNDFKPTLNRAFRDLQKAGDLVAREASEISHVHGLATILWELLDCRAQNPGAHGFLRAAVDQDVKAVLAAGDSNVGTIAAADVCSALQASAGCLP